MFSALMHKEPACFYYHNYNYCYCYYFYHRYRSFNLLQILSRKWLSGDQGDYSWSSEACQNHNAQLTRTLSKFRCLIHERYPTNHYSSQKRAVYGTFCPLPSPSPTTCSLLNLESIDVILSLSPLNLRLLSSLLGAFV